MAAAKNRLQPFHTKDSRALEPLRALRHRVDPPTKVVFQARHVGPCRVGEETEVAEHPLEIVRVKRDHTGLHEVEDLLDISR